MTKSKRVAALAVTIILISSNTPVIYYDDRLIEKIKNPIIPVF